MKDRWQPQEAAASALSPSVPTRSTSGSKDRGHHHRIDDIAPNRTKYNHRLMDYNNDPTTTWADMQKFFKLLEARVAKRLGEKQ